jgi:hypothetical protein
MTKKDMAFILLNEIGCDEKMRSHEIRYIDAVNYLMKKTDWSFNSCKNLVYMYQKDSKLV